MQFQDRTGKSSRLWGRTMTQRLNNWPPSNAPSLMAGIKKEYWWSEPENTTIKLLEALGWNKEAPVSSGRVYEGRTEGVQAGRRQRYPAHLTWGAVVACFPGGF